MDHSHTGDDRYEPLFETDHGCVLHCRCCGGLQLHFGNAILGMSAPDFDPFRQTIGTLEQDATRVAAGRPRSARLGGPGRGRRVQRERATIFVGDTGVGFAFDAHELGELHRLLEGARLFLDLQGSGGGSEDEPSPSDTEWRRPS